MLLIVSFPASSQACEVISLSVMGCVSGPTHHNTPLFNRFGHGKGKTRSSADNAPLTDGGSTNSEPRIVKNNSEC
jgi:hypothetical protein